MIHARYGSLKLGRENEMEIQVKSKFFMENLAQIYKGSCVKYSLSHE